jgi:hypothetical protein
MSVMSIITGSNSALAPHGHKRFIISSVVSTDLITDDGSNLKLCQFNSGAWYVAKICSALSLRNSFIFAISASYDSMEPDETGVLICDSIASTFSRFSFLFFYRRATFAAGLIRQLYYLYCSAVNNLARIVFRILRLTLHWQNCIKRLLSSQICFPLQTLSDGVFFHFVIIGQPFHVRIAGLSVWTLF